jgi:hypothetical protein
MVSYFGWIPCFGITILSPDVLYAGVLRLLERIRGSLATVWSRHIDVPVARPGALTRSGKLFPF